MEKATVEAKGIESEGTGFFNYNSELGCFGQ